MDTCLTLTSTNKILRRSLEVSMQWGSRDSAGEESDEESIEEQIERDESTESLDELGLPLSSSKSSSNPRPCSSQSHLNSAELIVLDFGPTQKGLLLVFIPTPPPTQCFVLPRKLFCHHLLYLCHVVFRRVCLMPLLC